MVASTLVNLVRLTTTTVGAGIITPGVAVVGYAGLSFLVDGTTYSYSIIADGVNWECGQTVYTAAGPTLTRTVTTSSNGGAPIALSGKAIVNITALAADIAVPPNVGNVVLTQPATAATLTIADGKTLSVNNSLGLSGTDGTTMTFPAASDTIAGLGTVQSFTQPQTIALGTIAANAANLNLTATWNNAAVTFDAPLSMNITATASAAASLLVDAKVNAATVFAVTKTGSLYMNLSTTTISPAAAGFLFTGSGVPSLYVGQDGSGTAQTRNSFAGSFSWSSSGNPSAAAGDTFLFRDAASIIAQRNTTTAQAFRAYNTYTDASNYERGVFDWKTSANVLRIGTEAAGTGTARSVQLVAGGSVYSFPVSGNMLVPGNVSTPSGGQIGFSGRSQITSAASGSLTFSNNALTASATVSFPSTNVFQLGPLDAAAPVAQIFSVQNVVGGTVDTAGADRTYNGSQSTGAGVGGGHIFRVSPAGGAGSAQNALANALVIDGTKKATFAGKVNMASLPASASGLSTGDLWNNSGTMAIAA